MLTGVLVLVGGFAAGRARALLSAPVGGPAVRPASQVRFSTTRDEVTLVLLTKSTCPWSSKQVVVDAVRLVKDSLSSRLSRRGIVFTTLGVSMDFETDDGIRHLRRFGAFDEVAVGRGWLNSVARPYFTGSAAGPAATPQLLVLHRRMAPPLLEDGGLIIETTPDEILGRYVGVQEILRWIRNDIPVPLQAATIDSSAGSR